MALEQAGLQWVNEGLPGFVSDINKANTAMGDVGRDSESAGGKVSVLGSIMTGVATGMTTFVLDAVVGLGKALVGLGKDSIGVAAEFESSMTVLGIAASSTGLGMEELSEAALAVGGDTRLLGVSASGAAESMTSLFKAGLTEQEVLGDLQGYLDGTSELTGTLRASIDLAAATTLDMVGAADVAAITLATFGSEAEAAGMTTDEWIVGAMSNLVQAADASVAEVEGLVEALKMVGPQASAMGISLMDTNNALALLSTRGIQGSAAGTGLNRMLLDLVKTTPQATDMLDALGIVIYDNEGAMLPLVEIIGQFEAALGDATDAERDQAMAAVFTAQGARTMNTLLVEGVEGWVGMAEATANAATMQEQGAAKAQTFAAQQEALTGVIETLQIKIGSALLPALTDVVQIFAGIVEKHGPLLEGVFRFIGEAAGQLVEALGGLLSGEISLDELIPDTGPIAAFVGALQTIGDWFTENRPAIEAALLTIQKVFQDTFGAVSEAFQEAWPELEAAFADIQEAFAMLGIEFDDSGSIIQTVASVISAVIIGVGTVISGVIRAVTGIVSFFAEHWKTSLETAMNIASGFKDWIQGIMDVISGIFTGDWEKVKKGFIKSWEGMAKTLGNVIKLIVKGITMPFKAVAKFIGDFVEGIIDFFKDLAKKLIGSSIITDMMDKIKKVIETVLDIIIKVWKDIFEKILETTREVFETIERIIDRVMDTVESIIDGGADAIMDIWEAFVDVLQAVWESVWEAIEDFVDTTFNAIESLIDSIAGAIESLWESFTSALREVWETAWGAIEDFVDTTFNAIEDLIDSIASAIESLWGSFTDTLQAVWEAAWAAIEDFVDTTFNAIESLIDSIAGAIESLWESFTNALQAVWEAAWSAIESFVDSTFNAIQSLIESISAAIESTWEAFTSSVQATWEAAWTAIESFVDSTFTAIESLIDSISSSIEAAWEAFTASVQATWETVWAAIESFVDTTFTAIETLIDTISSSIETAWETFTSSVQTTWETIWGAIETFVDTTFAAIETLIGTISTRIETAWRTFTTAIQTVWETIWRAIETFVNTTFTAVQTLIDTISSSIRTTWETFTTALQTAWTTVFNALAGIVRTAFDAVGTGVRAVLSAAIAALTTIFNLDLMEVVRSIGNRIVQLIVDGIIAFSNAVGGFVANVSTTLSGWLSSLASLTAGWVSRAWELGSYIIERVLAGLRTFWNAIGDFADNVSNWLSSQLSDIASSAAAWVTNARRIGTEILNRIMDGVRSAADWAADFWNWLWGEITDWLTGQGSSAAQSAGSTAGIMIMDGMADGIQDNAYIVQSALNSVISGLSVPSITIPIYEETISTGSSGGASYVPPVTPLPILSSQPYVPPTSITIGPNTISDAMDMAEFEARVLQVVTAAI